MPRVDVQQLAVARVYARALLGLGRDHDEQSDMLEELARLEDQLDRWPGFEQILSDPGLNEADRDGLVERIFRGRASDLLVNTLQVMNRKGRLGLARALVQAYILEYEELEGIIQVSATTAVPLSDEARVRLVKSLNKYTEKTIQLNEKVDKDLLGGMVITSSDRKIDMSISRELRRFGNRLLERASEEIQAGVAGAQRRNYVEE